MTTDRPYRSAMSIDEAVIELRACAGSQFDPAVTDALIACVTDWEERADRGLVGPMTDAG
jgi:HD-GYP domain-containing protein (c-di-GMP phosphodiesterase class II)